MQLWESFVDHFSTFGEKVTKCKIQGIYAAHSEIAQTKVQEKELDLRRKAEPVAEMPPERNRKVFLSRYTRCLVVGATFSMVSSCGRYYLSAKVL